MEEVREPGHGLLVVHSDFSELPAEGDYGVYGKREHDKCYRREPPVPIEDNKDEADDGKGILEDCGKSIGDCTLNQPYVIRDS